MFKFLVLVAVFAASYAIPFELLSIKPTLGDRTGGKLASIESLPYQVSIHYHYYTPCSGVIISENWVLTAASCFINEPTQEASIRAGSTVFSADGSEHEVDNIVIHPKRDSNTNLYRYDIALVRVKKPFHFDKTRQPISMFDTGEKAEPESTAVISGWGGLFMTDPIARLRSEEPTYVSRDQCDEYYPDEIDTESEICVVYQVENDENPCTGDFGSPVTINGRLVGIVGLRVMYCGTEHENIPTFHTEVASYRSWIKNVTGI